VNRPTPFDPRAVERVADSIRRDRYLSNQVSDVQLVEKVLSGYRDEKPRRRPSTRRPPTATRATS
jgi:hypothetical protein